MDIISIYMIPIIILLITMFFCICYIRYTLSVYNTRLDMIEVNILELAAAINEIDYIIDPNEQTSSG